MKDLFLKGSLYVEQNSNLIFSLIFLFILAWMQNNHFYKNHEVVPVIAIFVLIFIGWLIDQKIKAMK